MGIWHVECQLPRDDVGRLDCLAFLLGVLDRQFVVPLRDRAPDCHAVVVRLFGEQDEVEDIVDFAVADRLDGLLRRPAKDLLVPGAGDTLEIVLRREPSG